MVLTDIPFRLGWAYYNGVKSGLDETLQKRIEGALRARNLTVLTSLWNPKVDALHTTLFYTRHLRQIEAFFKKYDQFEDAARCESNALKAFLDGERRCRVTNKRLTHYFLHEDRLTPLISEYVDEIRRIVRRTLGSVRGFLDSIPSNIRVSAGATASNSRNASHPLLKLAEHDVAGNPSFEPLYRALCAATGVEPGRFMPQLWNRIEFVSKNWKTKRTIACESTSMMPVQLAFDAFAKRKLRFIGVTLESQCRNQELARQASLWGCFTTVDLKGASDSEALDLVHYLFPDEWAELLMRLRSPYGKLPDGTLVKYEKYASMGNGCTFPIESLIFAACCVAVNKRHGHSVYRVYGDDIIIHRDCVEDLLRLLRFLGFVPNEDKTFLDGPFRESCGGDYWLGENVTPFYLRSTSHRTDVSLLVNAIREFPESKAMDDIAKELIQHFNIPLVPPGEDMTTGFQISVSECYSRGILSLKGQKARKWNIPSYWGLTLRRVDGLDSGDPKKFRKLSRSTLALQRRITAYSRNAVGCFLWHCEHAGRNATGLRDLSHVDSALFQAFVQREVRDGLIEMSTPGTQLVSTTRFKVTRKRMTLDLGACEGSQRLAYLGDLLLTRII